MLKELEQKLEKCQKDLKKKEFDYEEVFERFHDYQERTVAGLKEQDLLQVKLSEVEADKAELTEEIDKLKRKIVVKD